MFGLVWSTFGSILLAIWILAFIGLIVAVFLDTEWYWFGDKGASHTDRWGWGATILFGGGFLLFLTNQFGVSLDTESINRRKDTDSNFRMRDDYILYPWFFMKRTSGYLKSSAEPFNLSNRETEM